MSQEPTGPNTTPGAGAGDAAPTQAIPRIPKPGGQSSVNPPTGKPSGGKPAAGKPDATTDKGRPRDASGPSSTQAKRPIAPTGGPQGRPISATEYARTTKPSPATTAVIPAIKDKPQPAAKQGSAKQSAGKGSSKASPGTQAPTKPAATPAAAAAGGTGGRQASLRLTHVEPWSVARLAFAISVALMIVSVVAAVIFWTVLNLIGVWGQVNDSLTSVLSDDSSSFDVKDYFGLGRFVGLTLVLSAINVVLMTMFATIGAHIYNLAAQLMGGVEVTFSEEK